MKYRARAYVEFDVELPKGCKFLTDLSKDDVEQELSYCLNNHLHYAGHKSKDFGEEVIFGPTNVKIKDASVRTEEKTQYGGCPWCTMQGGKHEFECPYGK